VRTRKITALIVLVTFLLSIVSTGVMAKNNSSGIDVQFNKDGSVQVVMNFKDLDEAKWAVKNILKMNAEDIIMGYNDGSFRPNKPVTHAEAVVLTIRAAGLQSEIESQVADAVYLPFKDAKSIPGWAQKAVAVAVEKGYLQAGPSNNFQANKSAKREWVVKLIAKALSLEPVDIELPFTDADKISADTVDYVAAVVYKQLISGFPDGSFKPNKPITRAELAVMLGISTDEEPIPGDFKFKIEGTLDSVTPQAATVTDDNYGSVDQSQGSVTITVDKDDDEGAESNATVTYPVASDALIYVDDQTAELADLAVGAKVEAIVKDGMVVYLEVEPVVVKGVVQEVYDDTITVIESNWGRGRKIDSSEVVSSTYDLAADVAVTLNKDSVTASDIQAGDVVKLTLNAEEVTNIKVSRFKLKIHKKNDKHEWLEDAKEEREREREREKEMRERAKEDRERERGRERERENDSDSES